MISRHADSSLYLLFCLSNVLLYTLIKYFSKTIGLTSLEISAYMNLTVFTLYNIIFWKKILQDRLYFQIFKIRNLLLSASVLSALTKMYCIQYIEPRDAVIIAHTTPLIVMLFATIFLKEKMILKYWLYGILSIFGVMIYVWKKIDINSIYYFILIFHVLFKATMHIATKNASKNSIFAVLFYDNLFYSLFAVSFLFGKNGTIEYHYFGKWQIWILVVITTISLFSLVKSYSLASKGITRLQNLDFSKILFSLVLAVLLLNDTIETNELIGSGIILASIILSQVNLKKIFKKRFG